MGLKYSPTEQLFFFIQMESARELYCSIRGNILTGFSLEMGSALNLYFLQSLTKWRPFFRFIPLPMVAWTRCLCPGDNRRLFSISRPFINFYHFYVTLNLITKASLSTKFLFYKISFHSYVNKTNFHMKSFALSLAFIIKLTATRKWPIDFNIWKNLYFANPYSWQEENSLAMNTYVYNLEMIIIYFVI